MALSTCRGLISPLTPKTSISVKKFYVSFFKSFVVDRIVKRCCCAIVKMLLLYNFELQSLIRFESLLRKKKEKRKRNISTIMETLT